MLGSRPGLGPDSPVPSRALKNRPCPGHRVANPTPHPPLRPTTLRSTSPRRPPFLVPSGGNPASPNRVTARPHAQSAKFLASAIFRPFSSITAKSCGVVGCWVGGCVFGWARGPAGGVARAAHLRPFMPLAHALLPPISPSPSLACSYLCKTQRKKVSATSMRKAAAAASAASMPSESESDPPSPPPPPDPDADALSPSNSLSHSSHVASLAAAGSGWARPRPSSGVGPPGGAQL